VKLLPYGPHAVLAEFDTLDQVMAAAAEWRAASWPGVVDIVPAARTVLVVHDGHFESDRLHLPADLTTSTVAPGPLVVVPVRYDGDDLTWVADQTGLSIAQVIDTHSSTEYVCAFCGFMPGFAYLVGLPSILHLPRRFTPRTRVPAGSVAIASEFASVYPGDSPGGWHLLGSTTMEMWDDTRDPAATIPPGARVRFEAT
jgi:KipI family sensor histidine kinase inhibitor